MNKRIAGLSVVVISLSLAAVAAASTVRYDYDREIDFTKWTAAAWRSPEGSNPSLVEQRLAKAIEVGFQDRGYALVEDPAQADFLIDFRAAAWREASVEEVFKGPAFGRSLRVEREPVGALVVDVFDRRTGKLAWHGLVSDALASDPGRADKKTAQAVAKLLKKFPARGGGK